MTEGEGKIVALLEPLFLTNPSQAAWIHNTGHQQALLAARQLLQSNTEQARRAQQELATAEEQRESTGGPQATAGTAGRQAAGRAAARIRAAAGRPCPVPAPWSMRSSA